MSINRCRAHWLKRVEHRPPPEILAELQTIEQEILQETEKLEAMLR